MADKYPIDTWLERSLFAGLVLGNVSYGIHLSVFAVTMYQLCRTLKTNRPMSFWYFPYVFTLFALGTVIAAGDVKFYQRMWIDMRNIEGGPSSFLGSHFNDPFNVLTLSCYITALLLQDSMLVDLSLANDMELLAPVIILPLLAFIASTTLSVLSVIASSKPGSGPWSAGTIVYDVPFCSLTVGFNVAMTLAIVARMLFLRRRVVHLSFGTENGKIYTSVAAMFIESASIYAIIGILLIIAYARKSNTQNLILPSLGQAVCIASDLIILRAAYGRAWTSETVLKTNLKTELPHSPPSDPRKRWLSGNTSRSDTVDVDLAGGMSNEVHVTRSSAVRVETDGGDQEHDYQFNSISDISSLDENQKEMACFDRV